LTPDVEIELVAGEAGTVTVVVDGMRRELDEVSAASVLVRSGLAVGGAAAALPARGRGMPQPATIGPLL
jgi:hypothetical protein